MLTFLLFATAVAYDCKIPPVEVNIRALGVMIGKKAPPTDIWMSYELRPIWSLCAPGDYIGTITQSLVDTDLTSQWVIQSIVDTHGEQLYMICLSRLLGCIQYFPEIKQPALAQTEEITRLDQLNDPGDEEKNPSPSEPDLSKASKQEEEKWERDGCIQTIRSLKIGEGISNAMRFRVQMNGPGSYTFESVQFPGYYLTVDDGQN